MEIARVHQWAGIGFVAVYVVTLFARFFLAHPRVPFTYHAGPAFIGASGWILVTESLYLLGHFFYYWTLDGVQGLWAYAIAGALAMFTSGCAALVQGFKE